MDEKEGWESSSLQMHDIRIYEAVPWLSLMDAVTLQVC